MIVARRVFSDLALHGLQRLGRHPAQADHHGIVQHIIVRGTELLEIAERMEHDRFDLSRSHDRPEILYDAHDRIKRSPGRGVVGNLMPQCLFGRPSAHTDVGYVYDRLQGVARRRKVPAADKVHPHRRYKALVAKQPAAGEKQFLGVFVDAGHSRISPKRHLERSSGSVDFG